MNENQERATFEEFTDDQWWYKELDVIARSRDQRRAMAVVRNLLRQFSEALASLAAAPVQAVPDAMTYADKAQIAVTKEWARGWDEGMGSWLGRLPYRNACRRSATGAAVAANCWQCKELKDENNL